MSISEVTVKGTYKKADGSPETGTVKFRPALWQQSGSGIDAVLDSTGSFQTKFPSSDSSNWPDGLQIPYRVTVAVSSGTYVKELTFKSADSPIDLPTLFPILSDSGGSGGGGGGGGVPAAHAATHQPGGSDELPALLTLGNRLTWAEWTAAPGSISAINCQVAFDAGGVVLTAGTTSIGGGWAGGATPGRIPVTPGTTVTASAMVSIESAAAARDARMRIYWGPGVGNASHGQTVAVPLGGGLVELRHTAVAPPGTTAVSCFVNIAPVVVGERFRLAQPALWIGAGGEARPPGELIPGLGGGGGVPEVHAATHSPGGSDPLPELAQMGNLLTSRAEAQCDIVGPSIAQPLTGSTVSASGDGRLLWAATSTSPRLNLLAGPGGSPSSGSVVVLPGGTVTMHARARSASGRLAYRVYWFDAAGVNTGNVLRDWVPLTTDWATWQLTAVAPAGAVTAGFQLLAMELAVGQVVELDDLGVWLGAGGNWKPPGEPIPGLGFRTTKLGNAELLSVWQGGKWVPLSGDTGIFTVGNGTIRRVGNLVYLTATGYTPPTGFKPAQGGAAPTNVWYVTVDDWPTSVPGSAKL